MAEPFYTLAFVGLAFSAIIAVALMVFVLSSALQYGGRPPHVVLGATVPDDGQVRFWVRDNGPGLDAAQQAQLFTPFTRLHKLRATGHGLGLSIVQRIVHKLGGAAGVESQEGAGSLFYFTLPAETSG